MAEIIESIISNTFQSRKFHFLNRLIQRYIIGRPLEKIVKDLFELNFAVEEYKKRQHNIH